MNMPEMAHAAGGANPKAVVIVLRLVLLSATTAVAGAGVLRPAVRAQTKRGRGVVGALAGLAVLADALSVPFAGANLGYAVAQIVLTIAVPLLSGQGALAAVAGLGLTGLLLAEAPAMTASGASLAADVVFGLAAVVVTGTVTHLATAGASRWRGGPARARLVLLAGTGVLVLAAIGRLVVSGVAFDRRVVDTSYGLVLLARLVSAVLVLVLVLVRHRAARRGAIVALAVSLIAWVSAAALPVPKPLPTPGVPELTSVQLAGKQLPVLVTPQRPGPNLVHFPASAGGGLTVTTADGHRVRATQRPGAQGTWARVTLPRGRTTLTVARAGARDSVALDAGEQPPLPQAAGDDGPECASAALGTLVAGGRTVLARCPADGLTSSDAADLRSTVRFLAARGTRAITVVGDRNRRAMQAERVVRAAGKQAHVAVTTRPRTDGALLVVSGWRRAAETLVAVRRNQQDAPMYTYGNYLAPWLLNPPIVKSVPTAEIPLRFDPRVRQSLEFSVALENRFGNENASTAAYRSWASTTRRSVDTGLQIYGSAQVTAMPTDTMPGMSMGAPYPGQWIPDGTIVPVTGVLR